MYKVKVINTEGLNEETILKIEETMLYTNDYHENETLFCELKNSKNEIIRIFPERIELTADFIKDKGVLMDTKPEMQSELYKFREKEYVILSENTVITREEDNQYGTMAAIFPY